jgi:hypothetical protein
VAVESRSAEEIRGAIAEDLEAGGVTTRPYTSEDLDPPCAAVVPSQPYIRRPPGDEKLPFGFIRLGFDVLVITSIHPEPADTAEDADAELWKAWAALGGWRPLEASQPAELVLPDAETTVMGSVIRIEHDTKEP